MDMFLYLFTIAPIISVPPVLPFAEKTSPSPAPQRRAPIMIAINGWSCRIGFPFSSHSKNEREAERENTPNMVFIRNLKPNILSAASSKTTLITKYETDTGMAPPVAKNISAQIPLTPPVTISFDMINALNPKPYNKVPNRIIR